MNNPTRLTDIEDTREHHLYRIYDASDVLLYIGCSVDPHFRIQYHRTPFAWSGGATYAWELSRRFHRYEVSDPFPNKATARAAERAAITNECPAFNKQHNPNRPAELPPAPVVEINAELVALMNRASP